MLVHAARWAALCNIMRLSWSSCVTEPSGKPAGTGAPIVLRQPLARRLHVTLKDAVGGWIHPQTAASVQCYTHSGS